MHLCSLGGPLHCHLRGALSIWKLDGPYGLYSFYRVPTLVQCVEPLQFWVSPTVLEDPYGALVWVGSEWMDGILSGGWSGRELSPKAVTSKGAWTWWLAKGLVRTMYNGPGFLFTYFLGWINNIKSTTFKEMRLLAISSNLSSSTWHHWHV